MSMQDNRSGSRLKRIVLVGNQPQRIEDYGLGSTYDEAMGKRDNAVEIANGIMKRVIRNTPAGIRLLRKSLPGETYKTNEEDVTSKYGVDDGTHEMNVRLDCSEFFEYFQIRALSV
jgi:hypothetical protein